MKTTRRQNFIATALAFALAVTTAQAQQVPIPTTAAEVSGPAPGTAVTKAYVQSVGRMAYLWGWALVNNANRHAAFSKAPEPGLLGGVLPISHNALAMLTNYVSPDQRFVTCTMIELLAYLRANSFKTFIVSGGGIEFMRPWADKVYGIPPEQVIGSSIKTEFEMRDGKPVLMRLPELNFNDDKGGKPVGINQHVGRRPIAAFGNSTGDKEMLEYTQGGSGARFELLVLHDDAAREYAYGPAQRLPDVKLGAFTQSLYDQAKRDGWTVVSMKNDWTKVFAFEK
jgi:hypothetical protein